MKKYYSEYVIKLLIKNINIEKITNNSIVSTKEFKLHAVRENLEKGRFPKDIFLEAGIDLKIIWFDKPKDCLKRWRKIYLKQGEASLVSKSSRELNLKNKTNIKDEVDYRMCRTFDEVKNLVSNYIEYYNNKKIMWIKEDDSCTLQESSYGFIITPWFLTVWYKDLSPLIA